MIDGITILHQEEIMSLTGWAIWIIIISFILMIISLILGLLLANSHYKISLFCLCCFVISFLTLSAMLIFEPEEPTGKYEYKVTINETVSITEFYEKYEIIDQEGAIWIIREK